MYNPFTVELIQIQQYLSKKFNLAHFVQNPLRRDTIILQDECGVKIAFTCQNNIVSQIPIPSTLSKEESAAYIKCLRQTRKVPDLRTFQEVTRWWASNPTPLTYQQVLGLPYDLYIHFLTHRLIDDEDVLRIVGQEVITEDEFKDLRLWCRNGNFSRSYLGAYGVDGKGDTYKFIWNYGRPDAITFIFYIKTEFVKEFFCKSV